MKWIQDPGWKPTDHCYPVYRYGEDLADSMRDNRVCCYRKNGTVPRWVAAVNGIGGDQEIPDTCCTLEEIQTYALVVTRLGG